MESYHKLTSELIKQLQAAAPGHIISGENINEDSARDEMPIYGRQMPEAVLMASSTEEIAAVMKLCNENRIPVTPRGAGTGLVGGCVPIYGGLVIDTTRMNKILDLDLENFNVTIQPGVLLQDLQDSCLRQGMLYPPDPGQKFATVGGNVATNAGGMRAVKYGATRDYVLSMEVVLPTGEITRFGASVSKTSTGYSLMNLLIGSEGTLGIITQLTLKIIPAPKTAISLVIPFEDLDAAISTVPKIKMANLAPQALEFMERDIVLASERFVGHAVFPREVGGKEVGAYLLLTFDGEDEEEVMARVERTAGLAVENGAMEDMIVADSAPQKKEVWAARSSFLEAIKAENRLLDECDVVVPVNRIPEFLAFANKLGEEHGLTICSYGHAGDGNLHIHQCSNDLSEEEFKVRGDAYFKALYAKAAACGGLVSGEHGIGRGKVQYLRQSAGEVNMALMEGIKRVFDPNLILNPGKVCYPL